MKNKYAFTAPIQHSKTIGRHDDAAVRIDAEIKIVRNQFYLRPERRSAFDSLMATMRSRTQLLRPTSGQSGPGWAAPVFLINRLRNLAERQIHWLRSCQDW